jgi:hypothetical protein
VVISRWITPELRHLSQPSPTYSHQIDRFLESYSQGAPRVRNNVKLRAVHYQSRGTKSGFADILTDLYEFGADDDDLMRNCITTFNTYVSGANPSYSYAMEFPNAVVDWYLKLDKANVEALVRFSPGFFFTSTVPEPLNVSPGLESLVAVNLSPRNTFPDDLGTDGQRLSKNKPKTKAGVLAFIAKLFFLTSNQAFFTLWSQLKHGKTTPAKALDAAKSIAKIA